MFSESFSSCFGSSFLGLLLDFSLIFCTFHLRLSYCGFSRWGALCSFRKCQVSHTEKNNQQRNNDFRAEKVNAWSLRLLNNCFWLSFFDYWLFLWFLSLSSAYRVLLDQSCLSLFPHHFFSLRNQPLFLRHKRCLYRFIWPSRAFWWFFLLLFWLFPVLRYKMGWLFGGRCTFFRRKLFKTIWSYRIISFIVFFIFLTFKLLRFDSLMLDGRCCVFLGVFRFRILYVSDGFLQSVPAVAEIELQLSRPLIVELGSHQESPVLRL